MPVAFIKAAHLKDDEYYTRIEDVEAEIKHYRKHFAGKVVYCNCDDPNVSAFTEYFQRNWHKINLKGMVTSCYRGQNVDLFSTNEEGKKGLLVYHAPPHRDKKGQFKFGKRHEMKLDGDGSFQSEECKIVLMEDADIVVTNPPFSQFIDFINMLVDSGKQFLVMGSNTAVTYKEIFQRIQEGTLWVGVENRDKRFLRPDGTLKLVKSYWYTNMEHKRRHEDLTLGAEYKGNEMDYPMYDNYDAIEVPKLILIPDDYYEPMGVPITYMARHNPDRFDLIGTDRQLTKKLTGKQSRFFLNRKELFSRVVIQRRKGT